MHLSIQSILLNVSDLDRSVAFYSEVFEFSIDALETEVAALQVSESGRRQVLVLRVWPPPGSGAAGNQRQPSRRSRRHRTEAYLIRGGIARSGQSR
jgi:catechol 2,3-dioxygenase-like lactoylglutathione lyase family enzyme